MDMSHEFPNAHDCARIEYYAAFEAARFALRDHGPNKRSSSEYWHVLQTAEEHARAQSPRAWWFTIPAVQAAVNAALHSAKGE